MTVLKILISYPDGFATMADLKRDMAILVTSGRDWAERTKRLAARVPHLDIFSQGLVERLNGGWRITDRGRSVLEIMEARPAPARPMEPGSHSGGRGVDAGDDPGADTFDRSGPAQAGPKAAPPRDGRASTSEGFVAGPAL